MKTAAILSVIGWIFLLALGYDQRERFLAGANDFVQLYAGARLSGTPQLYEPGASEAVHREVLGLSLDSVYYSRPPFYALLLRPLGRLPYKTAYWTFQTLSAVALVAFLWMWVPRVSDLVLIASFSVPLLVVGLVGQDVFSCCSPRRSVSSCSAAAATSQRVWCWRSAQSKLTSSC